MKRKILIIIVIVTGIAVWYAYTEYNRANVSLDNAKATTTIAATALLAAFEKDSANAVKLYIDKVIGVTGFVKKIEAESNPVIIFLGDAAQMSTVKCSMDSTNVAAYKSLQTGTTTTLKGQVAGFQSDPLFGTDIILNRCVVAANP